MTHINRGVFLRVAGARNHQHRITVSVISNRMKNMESDEMRIERLEREKKDILTILRKLLLQVEHSYGKDDVKTSYERQRASICLQTYERN